MNRRNNIATTYLNASRYVLCVAEYVSVKPGGLQWPIDRSVAPFVRLAMQCALSHIVVILDTLPY